MLQRKANQCNMGYDGLTILEKSCTTMRSGLVRHISSSNSLQVCSSNQWTPYNFVKRLRSGLVGHWKMDEETGNYVDDDSGHENHGTASGGPVPACGKFTRGRFFNSGGVITISNSPTINFGHSSFSVSGWQKILDVTYPLTTFAVRKGFGCYFGSGRKGWNPGWEIAHGYSPNGNSVCIRDHSNKKVYVTVNHDDGYKPSQMVGKWTHYTYVFDRQANKVRVYVNGKKQSKELDISSVTGSVNNNKNLEFGTLYGWKTKGTLDEYRMYNYALRDDEVKQLYLDHKV